MQHTRTLLETNQPVMDGCQQPRQQAPKHQFGSWMEERQMRLTIKAVSQKLIVRVDVSRSFKNKKQKTTICFAEGLN